LVSTTCFFILLKVFVKLQFESLLSVFLLYVVKAALLTLI
jgi:hypothetical protein